MSGAPLQIAFAFLTFGSEIIFSIIFIHTFERRLRISQSALISIIAFGIPNFILVGIAFFLLMYPYYRDTTQFAGIYNWFEILGGVAIWVIPAYLITWQAKKYGIVKVGKLGLGAKVCLCMVAVSMLLVIMGSIIARRLA